MEDWDPDQRVTVPNCPTYCTAMLWIVPAKVEGTWQTAGGELTLKQSFQMLTGTLKVDGKETAVKGQMRGDRISFKAGDAQYSGQVSGGSIKGSIKGGAKPGDWSATRKGA